MYPVLFSIGPLTIHTYGLFVALAFLVGLGLAIIQGKKEGIPHNIIADLGFYVLVASLVGSRLFFILINFSYYANNPLDILKIWEGGLVFYGGVLLAVPTAIWFVVRHNLGIWRVADMFAPALAIGHALGRIGCFFAGCCYGKFTDSLPWGVVFSNPECLAPINVPLHPTQLYESAGEVLNFMILIMLRRKKSFDGQLFMGYLILYSMLRFVVEFFRGDIQRGFFTETLSVSQGISILLFCAGVAGYLLLQKKRGQTT